MKIHLSVDTVDVDKRGYAELSIKSNVPVEFSLDGKTYSIVPYRFGDETVLLEYTYEESDSMIQTLTKEYVLQQILRKDVYPDSLKNIAHHFKIGLKKFRILVVKYNDVEEREFSRYSLSNVTFGVVASEFEGESVDLHLLPSNVTVRTKDGYFLSGVTDTAEEGLRQALLIAKWFRGGSYDELVSLALSGGSEEPKLRRMVSDWAGLIKLVISGELVKVARDPSREFYLGQILKRLRMFKAETLFNPLNPLEMVALGVLFAKYGGGGHFEPDSYDIF
ncbi:DUF4940 domain-containing protein [Fervidobacterium thailandense]|uniref:DUF4940 domain-containing protein n=1 Tax=Fervidobacterium thailandense TaxID=1008305 RepID=A0A1E3G5A4_9BACT|nr:DUF4940 domain-containing protein [Fervidobacterium thailandense]ODN30818.1 hypothetical protein A4H02_02805 [Fervidobacterium thailandense]